MLGVGARYDFKNAPIGLFLNPYVKYRPLLPFARENNHIRTVEAGLRFDVVYNFDILQRAILTSSFLITLQAVTYPQTSYCFFTSLISHYHKLYPPQNLHQTFFIRTFAY